MSTCLEKDCFVIISIKAPVRVMNTQNIDYILYNITVIWLKTSLTVNPVFSALHTSFILSNQTRSASTGCVDYIYYTINDNQTQCKQSGLIIVLQYPDDNSHLN